MKSWGAILLLISPSLVVCGGINPSIGVITGLNYDILTSQESVEAQQGIGWHGGFEIEIQPIEKLQFGLGLSYMATKYSFDVDSNGTTLDGSTSYNNLYIPVSCGFQITHMTMLIPYLEIGGAFMKQLNGRTKIGSDQNSIPARNLRNHLYIVGGGGFNMAVTPGFSVRPEITGQLCLTADQAETNAREEIYDIIFKLGIFFYL